MGIRTALFIVSIGILPVIGCSSDDSSSGSGGKGGTGGASTGGTGGASTGGTGGASTGGTGGGTGGSATGGAAGSATGGAAGSATGGAAGGGGTAGASAAQTFCSSYETKCGFGTTDHYADMTDCITKYDSFSATRQACVEQHLGLADSTTSIHCTHAAGNGAFCNTN